MLIKKEINELIGMFQLTSDKKTRIDMVLRNFEDNDNINWEKIEAVIKLIIKK